MGRRSKQYLSTDCSDFISEKLALYRYLNAGSNKIDMNGSQRMQYLNNNYRMSAVRGRPIYRMQVDKYLRKTGQSVSLNNRKNGQ